MRKRQTMEIIETFGHYVENLTDKKPQSARWLLKTGWEAQNLKFRYMQDKRLMSADRHLANLMMDTMLRPLQKPEDSVIVSIFTQMCIRDRRGTLNLGAARFLHGCTGVNLDILARQPLWEMGEDFKHGTGHGVGYLLNVHEGDRKSVV